MAETETDPTETDATRRANRQYDWFTSAVGTPARFGYPIGEPTFDSPPFPEERAPGPGERAPGPGERRTTPTLPAPAEFTGSAAAAPEEAGPPAPLSGPPPWAPSKTPGKTALNETNGERWFSDGDGWSRVGQQTASTGEPGESGGIPADAAAAALAALRPGGAAPPSAESEPTTEPALPEPQDFRAALATPEGGWDPTATAPDAAGAKTAVAPKAGAPRSPVMDEAMTALENMKREQAIQRIVAAGKAAATQKQREEQARQIELLKGASADYVAYLERTKQPVPPELQKTPPRPDVKIRPWLDPEGKDALSVIAQTLGMLAVAAGGVAMKAPITAMQYFREAAEAWRRDEVDQANSKLKQFEMTMTGIKQDNEVALKQYEIADKQYAHNIDAKKAMMLARLDQLNLTEKAVELTSKPYDEALAASKEQFTQSAKILDELGKYQKVGAEMAKMRQDALPKTIQGAEIIMAATSQKLAAMDQAQTPPTDPERVEIQREHDLAKEVLQRHQERLTIQNQEKAKITIYGAEIKHATELLEQANFFERRLEQLEDAYTVLHEEKKLPASRTKLDKWIAQAKQNFTAYSPRAQAAIAVIERTMNPATVGIDRTFYNDKGNQAKQAFGKIENEFIPYPEALSAIRSLASVTRETRDRANMILTTRLKILGQVTARDYNAPGAEE